MQTGGWKDTFVNDQICSFVAVSGKNSIHCSKGPLESPVQQQ